ncbi:hypothetical protein HYT45_01835 [Candidatus Uhrbacteria bacterium]|nr:hypothetical protein [Candidatus Uhrbacteria bacterium]
MLRIARSVNGWIVFVGDKTFGYINKDGFISSPVCINGFVALSPDELRQIADKVDEVSGKKLSEHNVVRTEDEAHRPRIVCHSPGCDGAILEMKQGMNVEDWAEAREKFFIQHPCSRIKR